METLYNGDIRPYLPQLYYLFQSGDGQRVMAEEREGEVAEEGGRRLPGADPERTEGVGGEDRAGNTGQDPSRKGEGHWGK